MSALFANYAHLFRFCITHECTFENYNIRISSVVLYCFARSAALTLAAE